VSFRKIGDNSAGTRKGGLGKGGGVSSAVSASLSSEWGGLEIGGMDHVEEERFCHVASDEVERERTAREGDERGREEEWITSMMRDTVMLRATKFMTKTKG
jgi:hypothetical protein